MKNLDKEKMKNALQNCKHTLIDIQESNKFSLLIGTAVNPKLPDQFTALKNLKAISMTYMINS